MEIRNNLGVANLSRRQFLNLVGGMASVAALAACVAPQAGGGSAAVEPAKQKRQLVFWGHDQHPIDLAAEGFVKEQPDIEWVSPHPADRGEKIRAAMAAESGCPDIYWAEATEAQDWGCNDLLTNLTDVLASEIKNYHPLKVSETFIAKTGQNIGWPGDISVSGWYYRPDKLEEAGFGDTDLEAISWADFLQMAAELKAKGMYAYVFPADGWSALFMFVLHQLGGTAVSKDGQKITVGDEVGIKAMTTVKQMWEAGGLDVGWWSAPYWAALKEGTLVGDFAAAWAKGFWEAQLKESGDTGGFGQWKIAKFPGGDGVKYRTGVWGGAQLVNPKCGENDEEALLFMKYALGSIDGCGRCGSWGIIPAWKPYLESKDFLGLRSPIFGDWPYAEFWASQEKELSNEFYRPAGWGAVESTIGKEMMPIMKGELSVEDGMAKIVEMATTDFDRTKCVM